VNKQTNLIKSLVNIQMETVLNLIEADPHSWSNRPCQTCTAISAMIGRPFGCVRVMEEKKKRETT